MSRLTQVVGILLLVAVPAAAGPCIDGLPALTGDPPEEDWPVEEEEEEE